MQTSLAKAAENSRQERSLDGGFAGSEEWLRRLQPDSAFARYALALATVAAALALRMLLTPLTGRGAPFVLFFAATLITSLLAGPGPALLGLAVSLPVALSLFVLPEGHPLRQVVFQTVLYAADGSIIVALMAFVRRWQNRVAVATARLKEASAERERALIRTRETIELAPDAYFLADLSACFTAVNRAAATLLGYEHDELVGMSIFDLIRPEDAVRLHEQETALLVPGTVLTNEWALKRKDGTFVPVEVSANILPDGRWQAFVRDITERERISEEREEALSREHSVNLQLRESEERFRLTIEEAPIGMALVALDGRFVRVNHRLCEITGYDPTELARLTSRDITHPDDLATGAELARQLTAGEISRYQLEKRYIRRDRSVVVVMLHASVLRGPDGTPRYFIAQVEDITERKRFDEALRVSEAKFSGIVSIAADAIISVDEQQRITIFNEGAERIFGYRKGEVLGTPLERLIPERFREIHRAHFASFAASGVSARGMGDRRGIFGRRKNGEEFPAEASISCVSVDATRLYSVVLRDVTNQKRVEDALRRAVAARDEVLGIVAHDLRNPLGTILMQASLLERPAPAPERRDQTPRQIIKRSAQRMNRLIQDLLDVAMVEAGQLKVERAPIVTRDLVREVVETQAPLAESGGLALHLDLPDDLPDLCADRDRLLQVFENLIGNAVKFTPPGGTITVSALVQGDAIRFSVADTGAGIAPEGLSHLFDRFWQAATEKRRLGAGLGLPIARGIILAHGGRIWPVSVVGQGTTFLFTIPVAPPKRRLTEPKMAGRARSRSRLR